MELNSKSHEKPSSKSTVFVFRFPIVVSLLQSLMFQILILWTNIEILKILILYWFLSACLVVYSLTFGAVLLLRGKWSTLFLTPITILAICGLALTPGQIAEGVLRGYAQYIEASGKCSPTAAPLAANQASLCFSRDTIDGSYKFLIYDPTDNVLRPREKQDGYWRDQLERGSLGGVLVDCHSSPEQFATHVYFLDCPYL
ncbi:UNVERIFIED_ORG: hypothetical protein GGI63_000113 [Rhizobium esperanzae]